MRILLKSGNFAGIFDKESRPELFKWSAVAAIAIAAINFTGVIAVICITFLTLIWMVKDI